MRRTAHAIADIVFAPDGASLVCQCGEDFHGAEDGVNEPFQQHRVANGEQRRAFSSSDLAAPGDAISWRDRNSINPASARTKAWRDRNPEAARETQRRWRAKRKEVAA